MRSATKKSQLLPIEKEWSETKTRALEDFRQTYRLIIETISTQSALKYSTKAMLRSMLYCLGSSGSKRREEQILEIGNKKLNRDLDVIKLI